MTDSVNLAAPIGNAATDTRTIAGATVEVQRVGEIGGTAIATGQASIGTTSAQVKPPRETCKSVLIVNQGTANVWIGAGTVTSATGFLLAPGDGVTVRTTAAVNAISTAAAQPVHWLEEYDA